jgi:hypothetical protein
VDALDDLRRGWHALPANTVPVAGVQLEALHRDGSYQEVIEGATVSLCEPPWAGDRKADAWLISQDRQSAAPLLRNDRGELVASALLRRAQIEAEDRRRANVLRAEDIPTRKGTSIPLAGREITISYMATSRFARLVPDASLDRLLSTAVVKHDAPKWATGRPNWDEQNAEAVAYVFLRPDVIMPLRAAKWDSAYKGLVAMTTVRNPARRRDREAGA